MVRPVLHVTGYLERVHPDNLDLPLRFDLSGSEASLGRVDDNDFILPLQTISRYHAQFQFRDGHWEIRDVSINGIESNDRPVEPNNFTRLTHNDVISFSPGDSADYRFISTVEAPNNRNANDSDLVSGGQPSMSTQKGSVPGSDGSQAAANELLENLRAQMNQVTSERDSLQRRVVSLLNASQSGNLQEGLMELLQAELSCPICTEVLIEPIAAQCGHVFCSHCISFWIAQRRLGGESNHICPFCREPIVTTARVRTWDTFLSSVYNFVSRENRASREQILRERQEEHAQWQARQENLRAENGDRARRAGAARREREARRLEVRQRRRRNRASVARDHRRFQYDYDVYRPLRRNRPLGQPGRNRIEHSPPRQVPPVPANEHGVGEVRMIDYAEELEDALMVLDNLPNHVEELDDLLLVVENLPDRLEFPLEEELDFIRDIGVLLDQTE